MASNDDTLPATGTPSSWYAVLELAVADDALQILDVGNAGTLDAWSLIFYTGEHPEDS